MTTTNPLDEIQSKNLLDFWLDILTYTDNLGDELTAYEHDGEILVTHNDEAALLFPVKWIQRNGKQTVERWVSCMHQGEPLDPELAWAEERGRKAYAKHQRANLLTEGLVQYGQVTCSDDVTREEAAEVLGWDVNDPRLTEVNEQGEVQAQPDANVPISPLLKYGSLIGHASDWHVEPASEEMKAVAEALGEFAGQKLHDASMNPKEDVNAQGGRQSASDYFLRGLPPLALLRIGRILKEGASKYEPDPFGDVTERNWHRITANEHLEHALTHMIELLMGRDDEEEDHAGHFATRALFFLHQYIQEKDQTA